MTINPTYEFLSGVRKVSPECFNLFAPFYAQRAKQYVYPVYYQSVLQMIMAGGFYWKVYKNNSHKTLAIFKRSSIMGNYSVMLHIAPISLTGDRKDEITVIQAARRAGCSLKLCKEDMRRYGISEKMCTPIAGNVEYIYNANEIYKCQGGKFHNFRRAMRRITNLTTFEHTIELHPDMGALIYAWDRHNHSTRDRAQQCSQSPHFRRLLSIQNQPSVYIHNIVVDRRLECVSVIEQLSPKHWVFVMGARNYESPLNDVNAAMHWLDCEIAHNSTLPVVYANMGAAIGIKGLEAAKEKLRPCAHQQIYKFAPTHKLDTAKAKQIFQLL